jgi:hypothetical protein
MSSSQSEHSNLFIQMVNLKYRNFIQMIQELNGIIPFFSILFNLIIFMFLLKPKELAQYFIDSDGSSLQFNIIKGTDATFLWKITVRIECSKVSKMFSI